jgi:hypothetical protein
MSLIFFVLPLTKICIGNVACGNEDVANPIIRLNGRIVRVGSTREHDVWSCCSSMGISCADVWILVSHVHSVSFNFHSLVIHSRVF